MNVCFCTYGRMNKPVQSGLALTPAQVMQAAENGVPIKTSIQNDEYFYEGSTENSFDIPVHYRRGVDINDCWECSRTSHKSLKRISKQNNVSINLE